MSELEQLTFISTDHIDKFEMFEKQKEILYSELKDICKNISEIYNLKYLGFKIEKSELENGKKENHKHAVSIYIAGLFAIRVYLIAKGYRIEFRKKLYPYITLPNGIEVAELRSYPNSFIIDFKDKTENFFAVCNLILIQALENYEPSEYFGCCSKFIECSDAKKCLHSEPIYSKSCAYRKNLEAGRIFYGKNKNC